MKKSLICLMVLTLAAVSFGAMNFVRDSGEVIYSNTAEAIEAGNLVDVGDRYGVALVDIASNGTGIVRTRGVFTFGRGTTNALSVGTAMYYSASNNILTDVYADDKFVGVAVESAAVHTNAAQALAGTLKIPVELYPAQMSRYTLGGSYTNIIVGDAGLTTNTITVINGRVESWVVTTP